MPLVIPMHGNFSLRGKEGVVHKSKILYGYLSFSRYLLTYIPSKICAEFHPRLGMLDITAALQKASKKYQFLKKIGSKKPYNPKIPDFGSKKSILEYFSRVG